MKKRDKRIEDLDASIKWSRAVKNDLKHGVEYKFERKRIIEAVYRPFIKSHLYFDKHLNEMQYQLDAVFRAEPNPTIAFLCVDSSNPLAVLAVNQSFDYCLLKMGNGGTQAMSRWSYDEEGERLDNITDWALRKFRTAYKSARGDKITKDHIFYYTYAILHDPFYRIKYALNLRREFPHIPLYPNFQRWAEWGKNLMTLHLDFETVKNWPLRRVEKRDVRSRKAGLQPKLMLKADKAAGAIVLDSETQLVGVPPLAWDYKLANRSALEWILDQYSEKASRDQTVREKFDSYRFADYKEEVIELIMRVTRVSVETMNIVNAMGEISPLGDGGGRD
jgi:predicted helicase